VKQHLFNRKAPEDTTASEAQIPVIDLDPFFRGEPGALDHLADELRDACTRVGFFYIKNHGVPDEIIENAFAQNRRFHAEPIENKRKLKLDQFNVGFLEINTSTQAHSTVHKATKPNQNESFFVSHDRPADHPDRINQIAYRGGNYWPENLPGFSEGVMAYFNALNDLGQRMLAPIAVALGVPPDGLNELFSDENHAVLRLLHYPPTKLEDNDFGAGPHTDNSFLTILARMEVPGLAIKLPSGEWLKPPLIDGTFLVNIGNMMRRMSNDEFLSTPHGVIVEGDQDRYSMAYFHSPNPYRVIKVLDSCVSTEAPAKYEPALYADLIAEFFAANYAHQKMHGKMAIKNRY